MQLLLTTLLVAATIGSASATIITYDTTGSVFTVVGGVNQPPLTSSFTVSNGAGSSATITYLNIVPGSTFNDAAPGTNIQYGVFQTTFSGPAAPPEIPITIPAFTFILHVNETGPIAQSGLITGSSAGGTVTQNTNTVNVSYSPLTIKLGNTFFNIDPTTRFPAPSTGNGAVAITGTAVGPVPEPGTMLLLGAGLIGFGFSARKKFLNRS